MQTNERMWHYLFRRAIYGSSSIAVAIGFFPFIATASLPKSIDEALGIYAYGWMIGLITTSFLAGVFDMAGAIRKRRKLFLQLAWVTHIAAATFLAGYAVGVMVGPTNPTITLGLAFSAVLAHLGRWRKIVDEEIPALTLLTKLGDQNEL